MTERASNASPPRLLGLSVFWGYLAGLCLVVLPVLFVVENPIAVLANLRIVDELADLGVVRDVDVGTGFIAGVPEVIHHSKRALSWNLLWLAFLCVVAAYGIRALRQALLARRAGIERQVPGQAGTYFWARGLNVLFPFGPGDLATVERWREAGAEPQAAVRTVFDARVLEVAAIGVFFAVALALSGWAGTLMPYMLSIVVVVGLRWTVRPMGGDDIVSRVIGALRDLARTPTAFVGLIALSTSALALELAGLYLLKQAFSTREFMMLSDVSMAGLMMALGVASLARIVPVTPGGAGFYELSMVAVFVLYGEDSTAATTVAILDGMFTNLVALLLFLPTAYASRRSAGILDAWRGFLAFSRLRVEGESLES